MVDFWVRYVLLKEQQGVDRAVTLAQIEEKYEEQIRRQIEEELQVSFFIEFVEKQ